MEEKEALSGKRRPRKVHRAPKAELKHFRIELAYRGSVYQGWQKQAKRGGPPTVQELLERAARKVLRRRVVNIHASGRTDAGVHARRQVAHLRVAADLPASTLLKAINAHLPDDIRVLRLEECAPDFHSQLDVSAKTYRYFILNTLPASQQVHWPFLRPYTWLVTYQLDLEAMRRALLAFEGVHDFKSFQNKGTPVPDTVREIYSAKLLVHEPGSGRDFPWNPPRGYAAQLLEIRVRGSGFLKQMVRTIVGTVVEVGRGRIAPEMMAEILLRKSRTASGMTAPANGLFLDEVEYSLQS